MDAWIRASATNTLPFAKFVGASSTTKMRIMYQQVGAPGLIITSEHQI